MAQAEPVADVSVDGQLIQMLKSISSLAVSDTTFAPRPFSGANAEDADAWSQRFEQYVQFRALNNKAKIQLFQLLLIGQAAEWMKTPPSDTTDDF